MAIGTPLNFSNPKSQIIVHTVREPNDYILGIFTKIKRDGNCRMILNFKRFNEFLKFNHCKLESIEDVLALVIESFIFGSADLKDTYSSIPIKVNYQKYLKLFWKDKVNQ